MHPGIVTEIKTGEYELIDSGTIQVLEDKETILKLANSPFSIVFTFEKATDPEPGIKVTSDENKITFVFINANQPSYGTSDFVQFGKVDDKDAYISFRVHSLNDKKVRSLEFSIYKK